MTIIGLVPPEQLSGMAQALMADAERLRAKGDHASAAKCEALARRAVVRASLVTKHHEVER